MKSRISIKHLYLGSLLITAASLAIGSNQPVNGAPAGSDSKPTMVAKSSGKMKYRSTGSGPEAGVQLLMGILRKIGNEPLVAMQKNNQAKADEVATKTAFLGNQVDPAFVIRPQQQQGQNLARRERAARPMQQSQSEQLLAMIPKKQESMRESQSQRAASYERDMSSVAKDKYGADEFAQVSGALNGATNAGMTKQARADRQPPSLEKSINKLYSITKFVEEITANKGGAPVDANAASEGMQAALGDSEGRVIRTGSRSLGNRISNVPRIEEYSGKQGYNYNYGQGYASQGVQVADARKSSLTTAHGSSMDADFDDEAKSLEPTAGTTYMKPENPGIYKSIKEYGTPATPEPLSDLKKAKSGQKQASGSFSNGVAVAYIPPQLVAGIPGLRLGVPESAVDAYLKGKGTVSRQQVNGWKVTSLTSAAGKTTLQIYLRNGTVQAFRVFDPEFVPDGLGVNLHGKLSTMKKKFGQQQFILDEPSATESEGRGARNYVYPVNQISFQLARSTPTDQPTIQSLLLFQFL